jgi:hypothetical protein
MPFAAHSIHCAFPDVKNQQQEEEKKKKEREEPGQEGVNQSNINGKDSGMGSGSSSDGQKTKKERIHSTAEAEPPG